MASAAASGDADATLQAWRECGQHRADPVRFHLIETLARRAAGHTGEVRRLLDARLATLLAAYRDDLAGASEPAPDGSAEPAAAPPGLLAQLVDHGVARSASRSAGAAPADRAAEGAAFPELKTIRHFGPTWTRLRGQQRLKQSLATVPRNAGPLNSHRLVHQSLALMHGLSPDYLDRFIDHLDALLWLDQLAGAEGAPAKDAARADAAKKPARGKSSSG